jgi:hypothetical protein
METAMNLKQLLRRLACIGRGHRYADSRSREGYRRCLRCGHYQRIPGAISSHPLNPEP